MRNHYQWLACIATVALAGTVSAATLNTIANNIEVVLPEGVNGGGSYFTTIQDRVTGDNHLVPTFTRTYQLDIDGVVFDYDLTFTGGGGNLHNFGAPTRSYGIDNSGGADNNALDDAGPNPESITFTVSNINQISGPPSTINFDGFTSLLVFFATSSSDSDAGAITNGITDIWSYDGPLGTNPPTGADPPGVKILGNSTDDSIYTWFGLLQHAHAMVDVSASLPQTMVYEVRTPSVAGQNRVRLNGIGVQFTTTPASGAGFFAWDGGGADNELGTPENWDGDVAPTFVDPNNETLIFTGNVRTAPENNVVGREVGAVWFDSSAPTFTLGGSETLGIKGQIRNFSSVDQNISIDVELIGDIAVQTTGAINLNGVVSGAGGIDKSGVGELALTGINTYDGALQIAGPLSITNASGLGSSVGGTTIGSGTLDLAAAMTITAEAISLLGIGDANSPHILASAGSSEITVNVVSAGGGENHNLQAVAGASLTLSGDFLAGDAGQDRLNFGGDGSTNFSGDIDESAGASVVLDKNNGSGTLTVSGAAKTHTGNTVARSGTMTFTTSGTNIAPNSPEISVRTGATLNASGGLTLAEDQNLTAQTTAIVNGAVSMAALGELTPGSFDGTSDSGDDDDVMVLPNGLTMSAGSQLTIDRNDITGFNDVVNVTGGNVEISATPTIPVVVEIRGASAANGPYTILDWTGATVANGPITANQFVLDGVSSASTLQVVGTTLRVTVADPVAVTTVLVSSNGTDSVDIAVADETGAFTVTTEFIPSLPGYDDSAGGTSPLDGPRGLERDSAGNIYVAENAVFGRVLKFDSSGTFIETLAEEFALPGPIANLPGRPNRIALAPDGKLYITLFEKTAEDLSSTEPYVGVATLDIATGTVDETFIVGDPNTESLQGITIVPTGSGPTDFEIIIADNLKGEFVRYSSAGVKLVSLTSTAGNLDSDSGFSQAFAVKYEPFIDGIMATAHEFRDIFVITDPLATGVLFDDVERWLANDGQFANNDAESVAFIQNKVAFGHLGNNQVRFSLPGTATTVTLFGGFSSPRDILVYEDRSFDVNLDASINATDADILFDTLAGPDNPRPLDVAPLDFIRCDFDQDGDVDMADARLLMRAASL